VDPPVLQHSACSLQAHPKALLVAVAAISTRGNAGWWRGKRSICLDPGRGWTITSGGWNLLKKLECWEGHEQALIRTIRKETKGTEEMEEAGYRSPTWAVLRALQKINSATRIEGKAAMSANPFFQSAGQRDLLSWGGKKGPTVVIWESISEQEKESWLEESSTMHDWVVWCKLKKGEEEIRSFELSGKEIFSNHCENISKEEKNKKNGSKKKAHRMQSVRYRSWWNQGNISERGSRFMLGSQRSHCHDKTNSGFVDSSEGVGQKGRMSSTTDRYRAGILDGHRDRQIRRLRLPRHSHNG